MRDYTPSNAELALLKTSVKHLYCKIELLDTDMSLLNSLEGLAMDGSISIDADSNARRTFSASIYLEGDKDISSMLGEE